MTWWRNLVSHTKKAESQTISFPVQFDLLPGKLSAQVHLDDIILPDGVIPCWTYTTKGLSTHRQKELVFSLRRLPEEKPGDFPDDPLKFFTDVYRIAEKGRLVDVGDFSELAESKFLGHKGLLYIASEASQFVEDPEATLTAIFLTEEEVAAVKQFGPTRVMARLGQAYHSYPCPSWSDRQRPGLPFVRSLNESILTKVPHLWMRDIRVLMENNVVILRLLPRISKHLSGLLDQVPVDQPLALLTNLDPSSNGCLVWQAGQSQLTAIAMPGGSGTRLCGCFILFVPDQVEDGAHHSEDGFAMLLTNASWATIRQAIAMGEPVSIPANDKGMSFRLEWISTEYHNPVDGLTYSSPEGWENYEPVIAQDPQGMGMVKVKEIILLFSQQESEPRVETEPFTAYLQTIGKIIQNHFVAFTPIEGQELVIQFEVWPGGKVEIEYSSCPGITDEKLKELGDELREISVPIVKHDTIKFQMVLDV